MIQQLNILKFYILPNVEWGWGRGRFLTSVDLILMSGLKSSGMGPHTHIRSIIYLLHCCVVFTWLQPFRSFYIIHSGKNQGKSRIIMNPIVKIRVTTKRCNNDKYEEGVHIIWQNLKEQQESRFWWYQF